MEHAHARGMQLFDQAYNAMKNERGVRIEDMAAMLGSVGGHLCLTAVLNRLEDERLAPQDIGMVVLHGHDGETYFFGDAPNWLLCEAPYSLVSLLFGAAHQHGASVSLEMLHDEMKLVAERAGKPNFLDLDLPQEHQVDSPINWARQFRPAVIQWVMGGMAPAVRLPSVVGFALQQAVDVGRQSLDPAMITRIALGCALRAAKLDPRRVVAN
ncbi:MAG TPA: hypothetical protein VNA29_00450 [Sphingomicrobium sp.]|nr:hypothetical protein [Sphingomicrobium sp.]